MADDNPLVEPLQPPLDGQTDWRAWLGQKWIDWINPEVLKIAEQEEANIPPKKITAFHGAGPAIDSIWWVTFVQWGFALFFPFVVAWISSCPEPWEPFAHYPALVWFAFIPVVGFSIYCELCALRVILPTLAAYCAPFKVLIWKVSFDQWMFFIFGMGLATHADLVTNGLFLAKIRKTMQCNGPKAQQIEDIWYHTIKDATIVSWIPGFDHLDKLVLFGWGLMFLQPVLCLLYAMPLYPRSENVTYKMSSMGGGYTTPWTWFWSWFFQIGQDGKLHHADVLQWLAQANRMVSITEKNLHWSIMRATEAADGQPHFNVQPNWYRAYDIVNREFARITWRLFLVNLLEKAYMLEVQVTIFAISRCLIPRDLPGWDRVDKQMLLSVFLSFVTFMKVVYDAFYQVRSVTFFIEQEVPEEYRRSKVNNRTVYISDAKRDIVRTRWLFRLCFCLMCGALLHSWAKFIMAFICEDSMWNIPIDPFHPFHPFRHPPGEDWRGCVELSSYLGAR